MLFINADANANANAVFKASDSFAGLGAEDFQSCRLAGSKAWDVICWDLEIWISQGRSAGWMQVATWYGFARWHDGKGKQWWELFIVTGARRLYYDKGRFQVVCLDRSTLIIGIENSLLGDDIWSSPRLEACSSKDRK